MCTDLISPVLILPLRIVAIFGVLAAYLLFLCRWSVRRLSACTQAARAAEAQFDTLVEEGRMHNKASMELSACMDDIQARIEGLELVSNRLAYFKGLALALDLRHQYELYSVSRDLAKVQAALRSFAP